MNKLNGLKNKLLTALYMENAPVVLNEKKFFSTKYQKVITKYNIRATDPKTGKQETILESYSLKDVVLCLAEQYRRLREDGG